MSGLSRFVPWFAAAFGAIYIVAVAAPNGKPADGMDLEAFGSLPVVADGRIKPIDTVARASLMVISGRQTYRETQTSPEGPAIGWLLDVMSATQPFAGPAAKEEVFRIDNEQLIAFLELKLKPGWYRYSLKELEPSYQKLDDKIEEIRKRKDEDDKPLDLFESKVMELSKHFHVYAQLMKKESPLLLPPTAAGRDDWSSYTDVEDLAAAAQRDVYTALRARLEREHVDIEKMPEADKLKLLRTAETEVAHRVLEARPAAAGWAAILAAYRTGDAAKFNRAVADYRSADLAFVPASDVRKARFESYFNEVAPFYHCAILYAAVFLLASLSWLGMTSLNRAATGLVIVTLIVHTAALGVRMYLQGRPPVTNLYSSAVWIGWGAVSVGLTLERLYRNGLGNAVAGLCGFGSLVVAHFLALGSESGDTMEMMQAVLDTNFWLATHVTIVTFGYTASFVAGFLGIAYILRGVFTKTLDRSAVQRLGGMVYGVACFATLLSFTGTVLGGIWADQSWGRFWGWDPKENGALLVVIWNAMILHARWGGLVKQRGVAVLAALGNVVVTWSWFGTNQLGVGLHAYGGSSSRAFAITAASVGFTLLGCLGLIPLKYWRSTSALVAPSRPKSAPEPV